MDIAQYVEKISEFLRAAGETGLSGAQICEKLGIPVEGAEADRAAHAMATLPAAPRREGNHAVYVWQGRPAP